MTELQIGLLAIGALVIVAVLAYNRWTTWRMAPRRSAATPEGATLEPGLSLLDTDPLVPGGNERIEPTLDGAVPGRDASPLDPSAPVPERAAGLLAERRAVLDPLIDVIVGLTPEHQVSGDAVLAALPRSRRVGTKPFAVEGLNPGSGQWEFPRAGQRYAQLQAGIQMANRAGALNEIEFSDFVAKTQAVADALAAAVDFPDMMTEVARARELDQFASEHDAQLGFTVRANRAAWSPGYLAQHAASLGFVPGVLPGRMVLPGSEPGAAPILVLQYETQAALADDPEQMALLDVDLQLDVAQVPRQERPYVRLRECALALARQMEGRVTDEAGNPLGAEAMDAIGADLEQLYDTLDRHDLAAGSLLARRLFS
jgi:hypothetical protein